MEGGMACPAIILIYHVPIICFIIYSGQNNVKNSCIVIEFGFLRMHEKSTTTVSNSLGKVTINA